jgi:hypothetical protein
MNRIIDLQKQVGTLAANDSRFEEHFRHLDADVESIKPRIHNL